jgi:hypothetical protein
MYAFFSQIEIEPNPTCIILFVVALFVGSIISSLFEPEINDFFGFTGKKKEDDDYDDL